MRVEQSVYEVLPAGQYAAKLVDAKEEAGNWGQYAKFTFEVEGGEYSGVNVTACASAKFSSRSKLYKWSKALFGKPIPKAYTLDTADLLGRHCILGLEVIEDDGSEFNRVESIFPAQKQQAAKVAAPPVQDEAAFPEAPPPGLEASDELPF